MPDAINRSNSFPNSHYDTEQGMCLAESDGSASGPWTPDTTPPKAPPGPVQRSCVSEAAQAGLVCARAVAGALEVGPSLVGGLVAAFLGGAACGAAVMEWSDCKRGDEKGG